MVLKEFLEQWNSDEKTIEVHTSGSTGKPKKIVLFKAMMQESARRTCDFLNLKQGDSALLCLSLDHIGGKMMVIRALERCGGNRSPFKLFKHCSYLCCDGSFAGI